MKGLTMKLNYKTQMYVAIATIVVCFALAYVLGGSSAFMYRLFRMLGFCLPGLLYAIHPVVPAEEADNKSLKNAVRVVAIFVILFGLFT